MIVEYIRYRVPSSDATAFEDAYRRAVYPKPDHVVLADPEGNEFCVV